MARIKRVTHAAAEEFIAMRRAERAAERAEARIEAYGTKGFANASWRKTFKSTEAAYDWAEKNDATVLGTRDVEVAR